MNLNKLNQWLTLSANVGVLVGIAVVAYELQQTQTEMKAESSTMRAEMAREHTIWRREFGIPEFRGKIERNEDPTSEELQNARTFFNTLLRFYENVHYQHEIGVLDEEIWQSNFRAINQMCKGENLVFSNTFPDGFNGVFYRESFISLLNPPCDE